MTTTPNFIAIFTGSVLLYGCAAVDSDVKVPSGAYNSHLLFNSNYCAVPQQYLTPGQTNDAPQIYATKINWVMPLVEIDASRFIHPHGDSTENADEKDKSPLYLAYDTSRLEQGSFDVIFTYDGTNSEKAAARNELVKRILYRSDCNFDTYASRMRTFQRSDALAADTLDEISTATIGSTALVAPPIAAGFAAGKLLAQGTTSNIQKDFLNGDTVDVMLKAMAANRETVKTSITAKLYTTSGGQGPSSYSSYPIFDVLDDIRTLNEASSIYGTLETITQAADSQTTAAKAVATQIKTQQQGQTPAQVNQSILTNSAPK